ncbi:hypothetical protein G5V57_24290 [Nordella sp. HKS 07]|uniref:toll/interleukin-1 receptor domain-containing protein n=1 Tax=Nordella sp. HKS 07 TaxID=2712222 RepID=UPI0013E1B8FB|nr:toll/interleukin-1 receptor domain-containing protein [Nordella sp. HKS 07]QIG50574.1 hypothetical protein G5V57_24290 [Nordella sp. HKS 07]
MPFSNTAALNIFFSYASEDETVADALATTLRQVFLHEIEITKMSEFPSGLNWRKIIDDSIERTDILIAIATGRLKPSHSFTGVEIGSFSFSLRSKPTMERWPSLNRRMIPFAVLARIPGTLDEFQGVDIDPTHLRDVRFDPTDLTSNLENLSNRHARNSPDNMIFRLLGDIEDVIHACGIGTVGRTVSLEGRIEQLRAHSVNLCTRLFELMLNREKSVVIPKSKLVITVKGDEAISIEDATLRIEGPCNEAFGLEEGLSGPITWAQFTSKAQGEDIRFAWHEAFTALMGAAKKSNFIENNMILSFDRQKSFRIFTSRIANFYSNATEFEVYIVEILQGKDYGDPKTTLLLKAMEIGLQYRFMFLEKDQSEFSPIVFRAVTKQKMKKKVLDLLNGLNLLLQKSQQYGLNESKNIILIMKDASSELDTLFQIWDREQTALYSAATTILNIKDVSESDKATFIRTLESFCEHTNAMNKSYTSSVLGLLQDKIKGDEASLRREMAVGEMPVRLHA